MKKFVKLAACIMAVMMVLIPLTSFAERPTMVAHKAAGVTIDGKLDEWNLDSPAVVDQEGQVIRDLSFWQGANDCSVKFYMSWDEENMYLAADVTEDSPLGAIEMLPMDGQDNLKLYISTDPTADPERTTYATNDFLVYFIMYEGYWDTAIDRDMVAKENLGRFVTVGMDGGENVLDGYVCAVEKSTTGFVWEAVVPWSCFANTKIAKYEPQVGDTLSVNFAITDISYPCPGTEYIPQMAWSGDINIRTNPSLWGSVTLAE